MAAILKATLCPDVQTASTMLLLSTAATASSGAAVVSRNYTDGLTTNFRSYLNRNALGQDLAATYGGGNGFGIGRGLVISAPASGLNLDVAAGHANIGGIVEVAAATTVAIPSSAGRAYVWLTQAGALTYTLTTANPGSNACYIGNCTVSGGNITGVDFSGVVYIRGGQLWRETADEGEPEDTPSSSVAFYTKTQGGLYFWDGTQYWVAGADTESLLASIDALEARTDYNEWALRLLLGRLLTIDPEFVPGQLIADAELGVSEG